MRRIAAMMILLAGAGLGAGLLVRAQDNGSVAVIYYWKAKPGKLEEYNRYIKTIAERVDADAQRQGGVPFRHHVHFAQTLWSLDAHARFYCERSRARSRAGQGPG
jgi:hypothetical protein